MQNYWKYHDEKMKELKVLYNKISKQTRNKLQELFDTFDFQYETLYNIADTKTKRRINTYIEEWKDKELLKGYFGVLAKNIYSRTRVKNSEILELLIYSAYMEEQNKLQEDELNIFKEDMNYYYQEGQNEVLKAQNKKKQLSIIPDAIFLALMDMASYNGYTWKQYIEIIIQYNTQQIYRQAIYNISQQKEIEIKSDEFQKIITQQNNQKLNINGDKISGAVDLNLIGLNNQAKVEGIKKFDDNAKVKFIAVTDEHSTEMCHSLDGQVFNVNDWNNFKRYSKTNDNVIECKCFRIDSWLKLSAYNRWVPLV